MACDLKADGIPVLWVTQEPEQIDRIGDAVLRMDQGRVVGG